MSETWRQRELREAGWVNNGQTGMKQKWRWPKAAFIELREWHSTGKAIEAFRKYKRWSKRL